jgi:hypothetical protein
MSFVFNNSKRIGDDECSRDITAVQNTNTCNYYTQNFFRADCTMTAAKQFATSQPGINYSGSMGSDVCGSNIDTNTELRIGAQQPHTKCKLDLVQRPFATVPYLGRGAGNPAMESDLQRGHRASSRKTATNLSEKSPMSYHTVPLIPEMRRIIQNPAVRVESAADPNWIRGGVASREINRDTTKSGAMSMNSL